jgi:glycosyltransferase involved in cell wall biosynthesis
LRILHLHSRFFPEYSGTTTRLYNILSKLPDEILLIASDKRIKGDTIELKEEDFNNIRVKRVSLEPAKIYMKTPIHYIHTHNSSLFAQAAKRLSRKSNKPFIIELHAPPGDVIGLKNAIFNSVYFERENRKLLKSCNCIIVLTQAQKNSICSKYKISKGKITVVPNGADINKFTPKEEYKKKAEEIKERLDLFDNVVMYAGYMDRINGMIDLAKVIPSIITERPDTSFVFIGHGPEEDRILALSKRYPQVKFLPMVHYDEMPIYYQMCDLFIIPRPSTISAETVTPLKLLEVMAMEKPVLGSDVGGIAEVIKHGENGYLYEKGNMESFKKTLLGVLDADNTQIGKNARKTVIEDYTWDKSAKILQKVYEELV